MQKTILKTGSPPTLDALLRESSSKRESLLVTSPPILAAILHNIDTFIGLTHRVFVDFTPTNYFISEKNTCSMLRQPFFGVSRTSSYAISWRQLPHLGLLSVRAWQCLKIRNSYVWIDSSPKIIVSHIKKWTFDRPKIVIEVNQAPELSVQTMKTEDGNKKKAELTKWGQSGDKVGTKWEHKRSGIPLTNHSFTSRNRQSNGEIWSPCLFQLIGCSELQVCLSQSEN